MHKTIIIIISLCFFLIPGYFIENAGYFNKIKNALQNKVIPSPLLNFGQRGQILHKLGLEHIVPKEFDDHNDFNINDYNLKSLIKIDNAKFIQRQAWKNPKEIAPEKLLSSIAIDRNEIQKGIPILSLVIDKDDLYSSTGLLNNTFEKGRNWERFCFVSYFDNRKLLFATGAGVRIHGGTSRRNSPYSFRLYFREMYGAEHFKQNLIFTPSSNPIKHLVIHNDKRYWHFQNPLAYDISGKAGCVTVETKPVKLFLNGESYGHGAYVLTEHLSKQYLEAHYGKKDFVFARTKDLKFGHGPEEYVDLQKWALDASYKMDMKRAQERIDVENLINWWIAQIICANSDIYQGLAVRIKDDPDAKWFWINWDMDHSFSNRYETELKNLWEQKKVFLDALTIKTKMDARAIFFRRLFSEDPEFRDYFSKRMMDALNHKITQSFIKSRLAHYTAIANQLEIDNDDFTNKVSEFFEHRPAFIRELMQKYFSQPQSYCCHVKGPKNITYFINGYEEKPGYSGWYYKDSVITIKIKDAKYKNTEWLINRKRTSAKNGMLKYSVTSDTVISVILQ